MKAHRRVQRQICRVQQQAHKPQRQARAFRLLEPPPQDAAEAILDWIETHGGELRLAGPTANLGALADALTWGQRFLPSCGRLLAFLRRYGIAKPTDPHAIIGMAYAQA